LLGNIADCSSVRKACSRPELLPGIRVVTALALATEAAAVNVIIVVAARAAARQAERAVHWSAMAGQAIDALVAAVEPEAGLAVVVKLPALPVDRVVAGLAFRSKSQLVRVVLAVAGNALSLGILEGRREVAILGRACRAEGSVRVRDQSAHRSSCAHCGSARTPVLPGPCACRPCGDMRNSRS